MLLWQHGCFGPSLGTTAGGFHEKSEKMTFEHSVLERMENMGIKVVCVFREWTFLQNMGMRALIFHEKSEKRTSYRLS